MNSMPSIFPMCLILHGLSQGKCVGTKVCVLAWSLGLKEGKGWRSNGSPCVAMPPYWGRLDKGNASLA